MRSTNHRSNILLVEILIAVLFFMLSAIVLVQVFVGARNTVVRAAAETDALMEAQNVADTVYAAEDPEEALREMGFIASHGTWTRASGDYTIYVEGEESQTESGSMWTGQVRAFYRLRNTDVARQADEELFSLTLTRYRGDSHEP